MNLQAGIWRNGVAAALIAISCGALAVHEAAAQAPPSETLPAPQLQAPETLEPKLILPEDRPIGTISANIATKGEKLPTNIAEQRYEDIPDVSGDIPRPWEESLYFWDAPDMCHRPLYFQEVNLERYGYSHCQVLQPVISAGKFVGATIILPYSMAARPPSECIYPLGQYRAGSRVPFRHQWPPASIRGGIVETAVVLGLVFALP